MLMLEEPYGNKQELEEALSFWQLAMQKQKMSIDLMLDISYCCVAVMHFFNVFAQMA